MRIEPSSNKLKFVIKKVKKYILVMTLDEFKMMKLKDSGNGRRDKEMF